MTILENIKDFYNNRRIIYILRLHIYEPFGGSVAEWIGRSPNIVKKEIFSFLRKFDLQIFEERVIVFSSKEQSNLFIGGLLFWHPKEYKPYLEKIFSYYTNMLDSGNVIGILYEGILEKNIAEMNKQHMFIIEKNSSVGVHTSSIKHFLFLV